MVSKVIHTPPDGPNVDGCVGNVLLAPERLLPSDGYGTASILIWRRHSHLAPKCSKGRLFFSFHYWLLLLSGDVQTNSGPVRYTCSVCCKSVTSNQQGICCDTCD